MKKLLLVKKKDKKTKQLRVPTDYHIRVSLLIMFTFTTAKRENRNVLQRGEAYTRVLQCKTDIGVHALLFTKLKIFLLL